MAKQHGLLVAIALLLTLSPCHLVTLSSSAHPVPRKSHDRTIVVQLTPEAVVVEYRLEVDEWTAVNDLVGLLEREDLAKLTKPSEFYEAFTKAYGPILADNLAARLDRQPLTFAVESHRFQVLDHLRCDFVFRAPWTLPEDRTATFTFHEGNYDLESGRINLTLIAAEPLRLDAVTQPDEELKTRPATELRPGDDGRLRKIAATVALPIRVTPEPTAAEPTPTPTETVEEMPTHGTSLLMLLLDTRQGLLMLLILAAVFGAAHALTPGHGKTLVAAYLVGERGTIWHALFLGIVTTLTHTGSVLILAALLPLILPEHAQRLLGLVGGLLIALTGVWLLLQRLSGGADHVHLFGGHHHHHHHHHHNSPREIPGGWWGLIVLGVTGGIVPCWDAIAMLAFAISAQRLYLAVPLLLAFSAGLAGVLVLLGIVVVSAKGFVASRWGEGRFVRALPIVSAALVAMLGFWLCYDSVHAGPSP